MFSFLRRRGGKRASSCAAAAAAASESVSRGCMRSDTAHDDDILILVFAASPPRGWALPLLGGGWSRESFHTRVLLDCGRASHRLLPKNQSGTFDEAGARQGCSRRRNHAGATPTFAGDNVGLDCAPATARAPTTRDRDIWPREVRLDVSGEPQLYVQVRHWKRSEIQTTLFSHFSPPLTSMDISLLSE